MSESLQWTVESVAEARGALTTWAAVLLPFCSSARKYAGAVRDAEELTQHLLETATLLSWYGADAPGELELAIERVVDGDDIGLSGDDIERLTAGL